MCGYDIACAEVEITRSTSSLSIDQIDEFHLLEIPQFLPIDEGDLEFKFAVTCGYPAKIREGHEVWADYKAYADVGLVA